MKSIVLSTSSSGLDNIDIPTNIELIRLHIHINKVEFIDGKNITYDRLIRLMQGANHSPVHTSPATPAEVAAIFTDLRARGYTDVFIVAVSSALSESYNIISEVATQFKDDLNIHVYDTRDVNIGEAMLALEAEHMMNEGASIDSIIERLDKLRDSHTTLLAIEDLSNLIRNKKLSAASGFFANLFSIKPVLTVNSDGLLVPFKKVRKMDKALEYMIDEMGMLIPRADSFSYILSTGRPTLDRTFVTEVKARTRIRNIPILNVGSISLANHGPTGVVLCVFDGTIPYAAKFFK